MALCVLLVGVWFDDMHSRVEQWKSKFVRVGWLCCCWCQTFITLSHSWDELGFIGRKNRIEALEKVCWCQAVRSRRRHWLIVSEMRRRLIESCGRLGWQSGMLQNVYRDKSFQKLSIRGLFPMFGIIFGSICLEEWNSNGSMITLPATEKFFINYSKVPMPQMVVSELHKTIHGYRKLSVRVHPFVSKINKYLDHETNVASMHPY